VPIGEATDSFSSQLSETKRNKVVGLKRKRSERGDEDRRTRAGLSRVTEKRGKGMEDTFATLHNGGLGQQTFRRGGKNDGPRGNQAGSATCKNLLQLTKEWL